MTKESKNIQDPDRLLVAIDGSIEFIANSLGEEVHLRQMIDLWCIDQLGNTEEALDKADAMFTAARDIFYGSIKEEIPVETLSATDLKIDHIKKTVCKHFRCSESAIDSRSRKTEEMWPRHVYSWMVHKRVVPNSISLEAIGLMTGDRTHASVINSIKKANNRIETDRNFRDDISIMLSVYGWGIQVGKKEVELRRI